MMEHQDPTETLLQDFLDSHEPLEGVQLEAGQHPTLP